MGLLTGLQLQLGIITPHRKRPTRPAMFTIVQFNTIAVAQFLAWTLNCFSSKNSLFTCCLIYILSLQVPLSIDS